MAVVAFSSDRVGRRRSCDRSNACSSICRQTSTAAIGRREDAVANAVEESRRGVRRRRVRTDRLRRARRVGNPLAGRRAPHPPCRDEDLASMPWLLQRVSRNAVAALTPQMDVPQSAQPDRAHALKTGIAARLAVPLPAGPRRLRVDRRTPPASRGMAGRRSSSACGWSARSSAAGSSARRHGRCASARREPRVLPRPRCPRRHAVPAGGGARTRPEADQIIGESRAFRAALARLDAGGAARRHGAAARRDRAPARNCSRGAARPQPPARPDA